MSYSLSSSPPASSLTSYSSLSILKLPGVSVTLRAALTMSQSSPSYSPHPTPIVLAAGVLIAILLIVVVLIASCRICQLSFVSDMQSNSICVKTALQHVMITAMGVTLGAFAGNAKCVVAYIDVHTVDIKNRPGLSHYTWNPLRVCECDPSICSNVPCLDSQCKRGAMTRIVRTHPVGKCPDTAASRRKMP